MSNEQFEKHCHARVAEILQSLEGYSPHDKPLVLAQRIVELEAVIHRVQGVIIRDDWEVTLFLARQAEKEEESNE